MILLHRLNGSEIMLNAELIESLEVGRETVISLATGNRFLVRESAQEVTDKVLEYRIKVNAQARVVNPIAGFERKTA